MRWNNKIEKEPKDGDIKVVKKFAYFPVKIEDKSCWLEEYEVKYRWGTHEVDEYAGIWAMSTRTEWIFIEKSLIEKSN